MRNTISSTAMASDSCGVIFDKTINGLVTIDDNTISSGGSGEYTVYGVYFADTINATCTLTLSHNTILVSPYIVYGIYFKQAIITNSNLIINHNSISNVEPSESSNIQFYGIWFNGVVNGNFAINNNIISSPGPIDPVVSPQNSVSCGIYFYATVSTPDSGDLNNPSAIIGGNNISSFGTGSNYGIHFNNRVSTGRLNIMSNTISSCSASSSNSYAICFEQDVSGSLIFQFNTVSASTASLSAYGIYFNSEINTDAFLSFEANVISVSAIATSGSTSTACAVKFNDSISKNVRFTNNIISASSTVSATGIDFPTTQSATGTIIIQSNTITVTSDSSSATGASACAIKFSGIVSPQTSIFFQGNIISTTSSFSNSYGILFSNAVYGNITLGNRTLNQGNVILCSVTNTSASYMPYELDFASTIGNSSTVIITNNDFYSRHSNGADVYAINFESTINGNVTNYDAESTNKFYYDGGGSSSAFRGASQPDPTNFITQSPATINSTTATVKWADSQGKVFNISVLYATTSSYNEDAWQILQYPATGTQISLQIFAIRWNLQELIFPGHVRPQPSMLPTESSALYNRPAQILLNHSII